MNRRAFLASLAPSAAALCASKNAPDRITRITLAPIQRQGRFHKFVTMNAYDTVPKGHT